MVFRVLLVMVVLVALYGCGLSNPVHEQAEKEGKDFEQLPVKEKTKDPEPARPEIPADVPAYQVTEDEQGTIQGLRVRNMSAATDVTAEEDLEAITRDLWAKSTGADVLLLYTFPDEPGATESGYGQAFESEEAGRTFLTAQYAASASANVEDELEEAMSNDGIFIVSFEEEISEFNQQMCDEWDVTTMGTPPPEMDCPGY
jgi:hypothetical protein